MARKKRRVRPRDPKAPKGFDSLWEYNLYEETLKSWKHHAQCIDYIIEKSYEPDFVKVIDGKALKKNVELVFLFQKPFSPMPGARVRRDGTKRTHAEWADKNNFLWYSEDTLPEEWK